MKKIIATCLVAFAMFGAYAFELVINENKVLTGFDGDCPADLVIDEGVVEIGKSAFDGTYNIVTELRSVTIPSTVTNVASFAFYNCANLTNVIWKGDIKNVTVAPTAFLLTKYTPPVFKLNIVDNVLLSFTGSCESDVVIPEGVVAIAEDAFSAEIIVNDVGALRSVTIPSTVTNIGNRAFWGCSNLVQVTGGSKLERVGRNVFDGTLFLYGVDSWEDVETQADEGLVPVYVGNFIVAFRGSPAGSQGVLSISEGTTGMADGLFKGLSITELTVPGSVRRIPVDAFASCCLLKKLSIGEGVSEIEARAFECAACTGRIERLDLPSSVSRIGDRAFSKFGFLKYVIGIDATDDVHKDAFIDTPYVDGWQSLMLETENGVVKRIKFETRYDEGSITNGVLVIPEGVTAIADSAFYEEDCFTKVVLPSTLKSIGEEAFMSCRTLVSVEGGTNLERVGRDAFDGTLFLYGADSWEDVESNGDYAAEKGLDLRYVGNFIVAARGSLKESQDNESWQYLLSLRDGTTGMADGLFKGLPITDLTIPGSVRRIPVEAFASCCRLKNLSIGNGVEEIESGAFECAGCEYPTESLVLPSSVSKIGDRAFSGYGFLKYVSGLDASDVVHGNAFAGTPYVDGWNSPLMVIENGVITGLKWENRYDEGCITNGVLVVPEGVTSIASGVFDYEVNEVEKLETVKLPSSLTQIGDFAFSGCENLRNVEGGANLRRVGRNVFDGTLFLYGVDSWEDVATQADKGLVPVYVGDFIVAFRGSAAGSSGVLSINEGTTGMADGLFKEMPITSVTVPGSVKCIPLDAFAGCRISSLTLKEGVEAISGSAFRGNGNLKSVELPVSMSSVGEEAFRDCGKLNSVVFKSVDTVFDASSFRGSAVRLPVLRKTGYRVTGWKVEAVNGADASLEATFGAGDNSPFASARFYGTGNSVDDKMFTGEYVWKGYEVVPVEGPNRYSISFKANGASGSMADQPMLYNKAAYLVPNAFVRSACEFLGWALTPDGDVVYEDGAQVRNLTSTDEAVVNLYAVWKHKSIWGGSDGSDTPGGGASGGFLDDEDAPFSASAALVYDGYVLGDDDGVAGIVQVKVGKANKKTGIAKVTAAVTMIGQKKVTIKGTTTDGVLGRLAAKDGRILDLVLFASSMSGTFDGMRIEGAVNLFSSKDKELKAFADSIIDDIKGVVSVVFFPKVGNDFFSIEVKNKGKVKVTGYLTNGAKVSINTQLVIGNAGYAIPVCYSKKGNKVSFVLWIHPDGTLTIGNCDDELYPKMIVGWHDSGAELPEGVSMQISFDDAPFAGIGADVNEDLLPNGTEVVQDGSRWTVAKAGKVKYKDGEWTLSGENHAGLKLSYKYKTGFFTGSFRVYAIVGNKLKKYTAKINGLCLDGVCYGMAVVKKPAANWLLTIR